MTLPYFRRLTVGVVLLCAPGLGACYSYIPAQIGGPVRGDRIRAVVENRPSFSVGDRTVHEVTGVDGEVITWRPDTLALSATSLQSFDQSYLGGGYTVHLPVGDITALSLRRLNKRNTILLAAAAVAGAFLANRYLGGGGMAGDNPPGGGVIK